MSLNSQPNNHFMASDPYFVFPIDINTQHFPGPYLLCDLLTDMNYNPCLRDLSRPSRSLPLRSPCLLCKQTANEQRLRRFVLMSLCTSSMLLLDPGAVRRHPGGCVFGSSVRPFAGRLVTMHFMDTTCVHFQYLSGVVRLLKVVSFTIHFNSIPKCSLSVWICLFLFIWAVWFFWC